MNKNNKKVKKIKIKLNLIDKKNSSLKMITLTKKIKIIKMNKTIKNKIKQNKFNTREKDLITVISKTTTIQTYKIIINILITIKAEI